MTPIDTMPGTALIPLAGPVSERGRRLVAGHTADSVARYIPVSFPSVN
jgi:hypothetical protein